MLRLGVGLMFIGLIAAVQGAQADEDYFAPKVDLLATRFAYSGTDSLSPYQLGASVALARQMDMPPIEPGFGSTSPLPTRSNPQQGTAGVINSHWHQSYGGDRISLPRLLRLEFNVEQFDVVLRPHSVSIGGERLKVTFLPRSTLIEGGRLKIMLQPHSASMLWSNAF